MLESISRCSSFETKEYGKPFKKIKRKVFFKRVFVNRKALAMFTYHDSSRLLYRAEAELRLWKEAKQYPITFTAIMRFSLNSKSFILVKIFSSLHNDELHQNNVDTAQFKKWKKLDAFFSLSIYFLCTLNISISLQFFQLSTSTRIHMNFWLIFSFKANSIAAWVENFTLLRTIYSDIFNELSVRGIESLELVFDSFDFLI